MNVNDFLSFDFFLKSVIICCFTKPCQLVLVVRFTFISIVKFKKKNEVLYIKILPGKLFRTLKYMTNNRFLITGYRMNIYIYILILTLKKFKDISITFTYFCQSSCLKVKGQFEEVDSLLPPRSHGSV